MANKYKVILILIIFIASFLRLWQLGNVPPSPDWDEAALGYNAYSIMLTGHDEYGKFLPLVLRSFDDYKPGLYAYLIIPFIKIFGLNTVSVRLPSVIFGTATVFFIYFLVKNLFQNSSLVLWNKKINIEHLALLTSFFLAISPWHIQFCRIAFESNVGLSLNVIAFLLFLIGLKKAPCLLLSFFIGASNIYMYQSEKVFTPLLFIALILVFRNELLKMEKKWIISSFLTAFIVALPMINFTLTDKNAMLRAKGVSVFADQTNFLKRNVEKLIVDKDNNDYLGMVLDNRRVEYAKAVISGYITHFNPNWLFITGDVTGRHHAPHMGHLYLFELPFLLIGIYQLLFLNFNKKAKLAVFAYFLLVPIPASFTTGVPHAVRTLNVLGILPIVLAFGAISIGYKVLSVKHQLIKYIIYFFSLIFIIFNIAYFLNQYFVQQNYFYSQDWQYGYKEAVDYIKPIMKNYEKIVVSNEAFLDQSYMFFLYYFQYDPKKYQESGGTVSGGFKENHKGFLNITFKPINADNEGDVLFVGRPQDVPENAKLLKTIYYLDGKEAIKIFEKKS